MEEVTAQMASGGQSNLGFTRVSNSFNISILLDSFIVLGFCYAIIRLCNYSTTLLLYYDCFYANDLRFILMCITNTLIYINIDIPFKDSDGTSAPNAVSNALLCDIIYNNSALFIPEILAKGVRILFYNGQLDGSICNNLGNSQCLQQLNYGGDWYKLNKVPFLTKEPNESKYLTAGYVKESMDKLLSYIVISDSGHLVPYDQPYNILAIVKNWIDGGKWDVKYQSNL